MRDKHTFFSRKEGPGAASLWTRAMGVRRRDTLTSNSLFKLYLALPWEPDSIAQSRPAGGYTTLPEQPLYRESSTWWGTGRSPWCWISSWEAKLWGIQPIRYDHKIQLSYLFIFSPLNILASRKFYLQVTGSYFSRISTKFPKKGFRTECLR